MSEWLGWVGWRVVLVLSAGRGCYASNLHRHDVNVTWGWVMWVTEGGGCNSMSGHKASRLASLCFLCVFHERTCPSEDKQVLLTSCSVLVMCGSTCVFCVKTRQDSRAALSSGASGLRAFSNSSSVSSSSWLLIWQATRPFSCTAPLLSTYWRDCSTWGRKTGEIYL